MLTFDEAAHRYAWNGVPVPGVTTVLRPLLDFSAVKPGLLQRAADFGHAVHKATELDDLQLLDDDSLDPALEPYLAAWRAFCRVWGASWTGVERRVFHPKLRYAGTVDRAGTLLPPGESARRAAIVDIKSSTSLSAAVGPQLAAYAQALDPLTAASCLRVAVQLKGDGTYVAKVCTDPTDWPVFASLLTLRTWCARHNVTPSF